MKTISNDLLRKEFIVGKDVPIYHTDQFVTIEISPKIQDKIVGSTIYELAEERPFNEMILSVWATTDDTNSKHPDDFEYYFTVHLRPDGLINYYCFYEDGTKLDFDFDQDEKSSEWLLFMLANLIGMFSHQRTKIFLAESATKVKRKNGTVKKKKQKVVYVTTAQKIKLLSKSEQPSKTYEAHKVCGHWSTLSKINPETGRPDITLGPDENRLGKDRYGNEKVVKGKTWVNPYKTGQGKEIFETIRQWR